MKYLMVITCLLFTSLCQGEIVTVTSHTATLLTQPGGIDAFELLRAPRYYPFSVQKRGPDHLYVKDYQGQIGWVLTNQVGPQKGVVVEVANVNIRKGPGPAHPVLFKAFQGVTFKVLSEQDGWLEVMHENGDKGWVLKSLTWGQ